MGVCRELPHSTVEPVAARSAATKFGSKSAAAADVSMDGRLQRLAPIAANESFRISDIARTAATLMLVGPVVSIAYRCSF